MRLGWGSRACWGKASLAQPRQLWGAQDAVGLRRGEAGLWTRRAESYPNVNGGPRSLPSACRGEATSLAAQGPRAPLFSWAVTAQPARGPRRPECKLQPPHSASL